MAGPSKTNSNPGDNVPQVAVSAAITSGPLLADAPSLSTPTITLSPIPQSTRSHQYQKFENPSPPPRCSSPVKATIGQIMGPPAPRPVRARSPSSMPPPPPRQPSQEAGARKRGRDGSPPLPGQGSPLPSYRRSMSPPPRAAHGSPHGSPLRIPRSASPPLPGAGPPLQRPRSSSPPFENVIIIPQRQGSPLKIPRRSTSPPLPGQGQGVSAFKRPRSASPSDAAYWHPGIPFSGRPLRKPDASAGDMESSASQRPYSSQKSGSSSSEEGGGRKGPPRDDADATSSVHSHVRGASSSSDENLGSKNSIADIADSSSSDRKQGEGVEPSNNRGASNMSRASSPAKRAGAMLPPPPRQPKRMSLPPAVAEIAGEGRIVRPEPSLSGESRVAHKSSQLAVAAAASSSTGGTTGPAQDRVSTVHPSPSAQDDARDEVSLAKQASDASSIIRALLTPTVSDASSVGRTRTPSPGPVSSGMPAVNSQGGHLAAGQSAGRAMQTEGGDHRSSSKTASAQGFKEPAAVPRFARGVPPGGTSTWGRSQGEGPAESSESGAFTGARQKGTEKPDNAAVLERVASNVVAESRGGLAGGWGDRLNLPGSEPLPFAQHDFSKNATLKNPPKGWPEMSLPSKPSPSSLSHPGGGFKVPQQRAPSKEKPKAQASGTSKVETMEGVKATSGSPKGDVGLQAEDRGVGAEGSLVFKEPVEEVAAILAEQEVEDLHSNTNSPVGTSKPPTTLSEQPAIQPADAPKGPVHEKPLEPALRALFPAAMYKEPALPAAQRSERNKAASGQPPYEIPPWSAPPGHPFKLEVVKEGAVLTHLDVSQKGAYMFGRSDRADFQLEHATVSRYHAVLQFKEGGKAAVYDLGSTHGTFVNKKQVKAHVYVPLRVGDILRFGQSSRLYVFQGPAELMPEEGLSRAEKQQLKLLEKKQESKMAEESLLRARTAKLTEVTWGQMEDAEEEDDQENVDDITWETYSGTLTSNQEKSQEKVVKRREKLANLRKEIEVIQSKEIAQGGLTPGQQAQIARNEQRLEELTDELESMEETLNESIRESLGAKTSRTGGARKRGRAGSDEEEGDSDDDEFYNRAGSQRKKKAALGAAPVEAAPVETAETLLEKRDVLAGERETLLGEIRDEEERKKGGQPQEEDALDAFMSAVSTQIEADRLQQLQRELELLDAEAARIGRLVRIADPMGEAQGKWVPKSAPHGSVSRRRFVEPVTVQAPAREEEVPKKEEPKPRGLLQTPKVALGSGGAKGMVSKVIEGPSASGEGAEQRLGKEGRQNGNGNVEGAASDDAGVSNEAKDERSITERQERGKDGGPGKEIQERGGRQGEHREGDAGGEGSTRQETHPELGSEEAHEGEKVAQPNRAAGGRSGAGTGDAGSERKRRLGPQVGPELQKRLKDRVSLQGDEDEGDQPAWEPPKGQTGDGRTALNDKLGY